jgi:hypothetical protein
LDNGAGREFPGGKILVQRAFACVRSVFVDEPWLSHAERSVFAPGPRLSYAVRSVFAGKRRLSLGERSDFATQERLSLDEWSVFVFGSPDNEAIRHLAAWLLRLPAPPNLRGPTQNVGRSLRRSTNDRLTLLVIEAHNPQ